MSTHDTQPSKRGRITKAEPLTAEENIVASSSLPTSTESSPSPTREELLTKLRSKRMEKRQNRSSKHAVAHTSEKAMTSAVQGLHNRLQKGSLSKEELQRFQEFQTLLENCGNDVKLACRQYGVREDIIDDVVKASQLIEPSSGAGVSKAVGNVMKALGDKNVLPGSVITRKKK